MWKCLREAFPLCRAGVGVWRGRGTRCRVDCQSCACESGLVFVCCCCCVLVWFGLVFVVVVFCCFLFVFLRQGLAGSPCWHQTQVPCTSVSWMLGLQACITMTDHAWLPESDGGCLSIPMIRGSTLPYGWGFSGVTGGFFHTPLFTFPSESVCFRPSWIGRSFCSHTDVCSSV